MKSRNRILRYQRCGFSNLLIVLLLFTVSRAALASTTWYVNGANTSDSNNCKLPTAPCKTITHAISLALAGDSIKVAPAVYQEHLAIPFNSAILGANAQTTVVDGGQSGTVIDIQSTGTFVTLAAITIRNGRSRFGGGIYNAGTLAISGCANGTFTFFSSGGLGGGIYNSGTLTVMKSTVSGNTADRYVTHSLGGSGGGIYNTGRLSIVNSTIYGNVASGHWLGGTSTGGGITDNNGSVTISSSTISKNAPAYWSPFGSGGLAGGIYSTGTSAVVTLQNSILAYNGPGGNCYPGLVSKDYNMSSDGTCNFSRSETICQKRYGTESVEYPRLCPARP